MNWENLGISVAALIIFLYNEWKRQKEKKEDKEKQASIKEEVVGVVRSEIKKNNGVPFSFIQHMPLPCWCKDSDGRMIWINEEYTRVWGIKSTEYEGKFDEAVWGKEIARNFRVNDLDVMFSKTTLKTIETVPSDRKNPKKNLVDWHIWKFPVLGSDGNVIAVGGIAKRVLIE